MSSSNFTSFLPNFNTMQNLVSNNSDNTILHYPCESSTSTSHHPKIFEFEDSYLLKKKKAEQLKQQNINNNLAKKNQEKNNLNKAIINHPKKKQTIEIKHKWYQIMEFNKQGLEKLKLDTEVEIKPGESKYHGSIYSISDVYSKEKLTPLNPIPLNKQKTMFYNNTTTSEDKVLIENKNYDMYITDKILSVIMTMNLHSRPWHVIIKNENGKLYFDTRDDQSVYMTTLNESESSPVDDDNKDNMNNFDNLTIESTFINEFLKEQILDEKLADFNEYPFGNADDTNKERVTYCYREWLVGDELKILVRSQIHAGKIIESEEDANLEDIMKINIYTLNEYDRNLYKSSDIVPSMHLKKELTGNYLRLTKYGVQSYLAGVDKVKIGFVSRKNVKSNKEHLIYGFHETESKAILAFTNFNYRIAWGIVKQIAESMQNQSDGEYVLLKTIAGPKPIIKVYKMKKELSDDEEEEN